ncbi:MAG: DUF2804 domain-containing protein [Alphaproteobacteria bacterium]
MTHHKLSHGPLFDAAGNLAEVGYATDEAKTYSSDQVRAPWFRLKEWDYYCVLDDDFGFSCVVADNGYMGLLSATWFDFKAGTVVPIAAVPLLPRGKMGMPASANAGDVEASHKGMTLSFRHEHGGRRLVVDAPQWNDGQGIAADIFLEDRQDDRMTIVTPYTHSQRAFYYNQKINCMPASGTVNVAGQTYTFSPDKNFGVLDWGRGVWAYSNCWYWGSASGLVDGHRFGFNIGYGFGDTSAASENMLFYDGVAHKLDQITFHINPNGFDAGPWQFTSSDGRFEMSFDPVLDREDMIDAMVLRSFTHQTFGRFNGKAVLDDGTVLEVKDLLGFAEEVITRW